MDWEFTTNSLIDRLQALENTHRSHAQRTADIQGAINMVDAKVMLQYAAAAPAAVARSHLSL